MNGEVLHDAMNHLDQDLIDEVDTLRRRERVKRPVIRALIPAACLCIALIGAFSMLPRLGAFDTAENNGAAEPENQADYADGAAMGSSWAEYSNGSVMDNPVSYGYGYANMTVYLPEGWEYEIREYDPESISFGFAFWPEGCTGKVSVNFYSSFGVCGTGLAQEEITFAGEEAWMGTYDNHAVWDFISFKYLPGSYVVMTEGVEDWWDTHGGQAMEILENMELAKDIMTRDQAIEIAKPQFEGEYDDIRTSFDFESGEWYVGFRKDSAEVFSVHIPFAE